MTCPICNGHSTHRHCSSPGCSWWRCKDDEIDFNGYGDWILHDGRRKT